MGVEASTASYHDSAIDVVRSVPVHAYGSRTSWQLTGGSGQGREEEKFSRPWRHENTSPGARNGVLGGNRLGFVLGIALCQVLYIRLNGLASRSSLFGKSSKYFRAQVHGECHFVPQGFPPTSSIIIRNGSKSRETCHFTSVFEAKP
jgi:hypothetical protein